MVFLPNKPNEFPPFNEEYPVSAVVAPKLVETPVPEVPLVTRHGVV